MGEARESEQVMVSVSQRVLTLAPAESVPSIEEWELGQVSE